VFRNVSGTIICQNAVARATLDIIDIVRQDQLRNQIWDQLLFVIAAQTVKNV
jgi:hypothetical protein